MKTIYISKSKESSFDQVIKLKTELSKYNVKLIDFQGGLYTFDQILSSDIVIVVPPNNFSLTNNIIGKGQYEEISKVFDSKKVLVYYVGYLHPLRSISKILESYDYKSWGRLIFSTHYVSINYFMETVESIDQVSLNLEESPTRHNIKFPLNTNTLSKRKLLLYET